MFRILGLKNTFFSQNASKQLRTLSTQSESQKEIVTLANGSIHKVKDVNYAFTNITNFAKNCSHFVSSFMRSCTRPLQYPVHPAFQTIFKDYGLSKDGKNICPLIKDVALSSFYENPKNGVITFHNPLLREISTNVLPRAVSTYVKK